MIRSKDAGSRTLVNRRNSSLRAQKPPRIDPIKALAPLLFRAAGPVSEEFWWDASGPRAKRALEEIDVAHNVEILRVVNDQKAVPEYVRAPYGNRGQKYDHLHRDRLNQADAFCRNECAHSNVRSVRAIDRAELHVKVLLQRGFVLRPERIMNVSLRVHALLVLVVVI